MKSINLRFISLFPIDKKSGFSNFHISLLFFALLIITQFILFFNDRSFYFAGEYGCIAKSIIDGNGFSNPFCSASGKTAWMPPVLVYLLSAVFWVFGYNSLSSIIFLIVVKFGLMSISLWCLLEVQRYLFGQSHRFLTLIIFVLYIVSNSFQFFNKIHDVWLILYLSIITIYVLIKVNLYNKSSYRIFLYSLAFLLPLISPGIALGFFMILIFDLLVIVYNKILKKRLFLPVISYKSILLSIFLFICSISFWGYRNYTEFGKFIPVKSNLWFDFYQANVYDDNGVVSEYTFHKFHPYYNYNIRNEFDIKGEMFLMDHYEKLSKKFIKNNPGDFLLKIMNRFINVFIYTQNSIDVSDNIDPSQLNKADLVILKEKFFINHNRWIDVEISDSEMFNTLSKLNLTDTEGSFNNWKYFKDRYQSKKSSVIRVLRSLSLSLIPFTALIFSLISYKEVRENKFTLYILIIYFINLMPYVFVSHYTRYQIPLIGLFTLFLVKVFHHFSKSIISKNKKLISLEKVSS